MGYGAWATRPPVYEYTQCREKICIFKPCSIFLYITIKMNIPPTGFAHPYIFMSILVFPHIRSFYIVGKWGYMNPPYL